MTEKFQVRNEFQHIEALVHGALAVRREERQEFLTRACSGDEGLRREVESLLAHQDNATDFLATPIVGDAEEVFSTIGNGAFDDAVGVRFGPWRTVERIGAGGMGIVYRAERDDGQFEQSAAIKLIRRGMDTEEILGRFHRERQVLANLRHPNIARLIDGGSTDDGRPYLVMEFVEGRPIDRYCDEHAMTVRQRIELFRNVCDAVQHAHRNLIVHRDLKPSNVLVTSDGKVALLDFGVAKVLSDDPSEHLDETQRMGMHCLTPAYASPEQVRGGTITTATDVYSLGVILYELLTGTRPYAAKREDPDELSRAICEDEPLSLASVMARRKHDGVQSVEKIARARSCEFSRLRRVLSGDLDTIVMMALRKEPQRRYETVNALSDDLERFLEGRPVVARADTLGYRVRRFAGRNKLGVAAAILMIVALTAATIFSLSMFLDARAAQQRAENEASTSSTISEYLRDMIESIDPAIAQGKDASILRGLLDETATRFDRELAGSPREASALHVTVGRAYRAIGEYDRSEFHLAQAVALRASDDASPLDLADALHQWGQTLRELGRYHDSLEALERARAIRTHLLPARHAQIGETLMAIGDTHWGAGRYTEGRAHLEQAVEILRDQPDDHWNALATALRKLSSLLSDQQHVTQALQLLNEAREVVGRNVGALHPMAASVDGALGWTLRRTAQQEHDPTRKQDLYQAAVDHHQRALDVYEQLLEPGHPTIGKSLESLASALEDVGAYEQSEHSYLRAREIILRTLGAEHVEYGTVSNNLGNLYRKMGKLENAIAHLEDALDVYLVVRGPDHIWTSYPLLNLSRACLEHGEYARALVLVDECLRIRRLVPDTRTFDLQIPRVCRGGALAGLGRFEEAESELLEAYEWASASLPATHPFTSDLMAALASMYDSSERPIEAAVWQARLEAINGGSE